MNQRIKKKHKKYLLPGLNYRKVRELHRMCDRQIKQHLFDMKYIRRMEHHGLLVTSDEFNKLVKYFESDPATFNSAIYGRKW